MTRGVDDGNHPNRKVGPERTTISRHGSIFLGSNNINGGPGITGDEVGAPVGPYTTVESSASFQARQFAMNNPGPGLSAEDEAQGNALLEGM